MEDKDSPEVKSLDENEVKENSAQETAVNENVNENINEEKPEVAAIKEEATEKEESVVVPAEVKKTATVTGQRRPQQQSEDFQKKRMYFRKKVCRLCTQKATHVDYKNVDLLRRYVTDRGKILPRRITGNCAKHQRMLAKAIKRARMAALLPFVSK